MTRHPTRNRVNGIDNINAFFFERIRHFTNSMLRLCHGETVTWHDDDLRRVLHDEGRIFG